MLSRCLYATNVFDMAPKLENHQASTGDQSSAPPGDSPPRIKMFHQAHLKCMMRNFGFPMKYTCEQCSPRSDKEPVNSCWEFHQSNPLSVVAGKKPEVPTSTKFVYESSHLVTTALAYFLRPELEMTDIQKNRLRWFRKNDVEPDEFEIDVSMKHVLEALDEDDLRESLTSSQISEVLMALNELFFFESVREIVFEWCEDFSHDPLSKTVTCTTLAEATVMSKGTEDIVCHRFRMHPTAMPFSVECMEKMELTKRQIRLGTIIHEMIHCFLHEYECTGCANYDRNARGRHGQSFQLIAMAIEDHAQNRLNMDVYISRLMSILFHIERIEDGTVEWGPSVCDMERYGFLTSLELPLPMELDEAIKASVFPGTDTIPSPEESFAETSTSDAETDSKQDQEEKEHDERT